MKKAIVLTLIIITALVPALARGLAEMDNSPYVASTSWVASIAELAGIDGVQAIAPADMKHPPEYEITADDMVRVMNARLFMNAGYERMMKTIADAAGLDESRVVKVKTTNTLENLGNMVIILSEIAGTQDEGQKRFARLKTLIEAAREEIVKRGYDRLTVYANTNQAEFARDLGLNVVATFGAGPLTADQLADVARSRYDLIIDNIHNPVAAPAAEVSPESKIIIWRNFPDHLGGNALYNVIADNLELLWSAGL